MASYDINQRTIVSYLSQLVPLHPNKIYLLHESKWDINEIRETKLREYKIKKVLVLFSPDDISIQNPNHSAHATMTLYTADLAITLLHEI